MGYLVFPTAATRAGLTRRWDVPVTELWYVDGSDYLGTVVVRRELTADGGEPDGVLDGELRYWIRTG
jgi:hypothetical protein